jgi:hypothetical protein
MVWEKVSSHFYILNTHIMSHKKQGAVAHHKASIEQLSSSFEGLFWIILFFFMIFGTSCSKDPLPVETPPPAESETIITDLNNMEIPFWGRIETIDFDGDRFPEFIFEIKPIGDHINKLDQHRYNVKTTRATSLPINEREELPVFSKGEQIPMIGFSGFEWWGGVELTLMQKVIPENGAIRWEGTWKDKEKKYLPFQVMRQNGIYAGWLEISTNTLAEKAIIHRAGICKKPNTAVKAGL